ncbi:tetratricopeptide repeat protein [Nitratidesulfovibrio sp. 1201_IL3209]|uniref:tetratricopeptide repeat protein n=1 Tax=Nitratidesulfovibrio sp. 1201_IL3209 TaxID=3084053 RepID=UPI002FDAAA20
MRHSGRAAPGLSTGPAPPPSARPRAGLARLLCGIAILLATAATAHAASTVTVPFGGGLRKESALVIARSAARLAALREGVPLLREGAAASFAALAAHDPQRRLAVASAVLATRVTATRVEGYPPEVRVAVTVQAAPPSGMASGYAAAAGSGDATSSPADGSDLVRAVLRNESLLELHEEMLRREAALTEEALDAAQATARHVARHGGDDESPFAQRLGALARSLEALELYRACLTGIPAEGEAQDGGGAAVPAPQAANGAGNGWGLAPEAVLRHMRRAVTLDARNPLLWNALGEALLLLDRPQDAMEAQDRALRLSPGFARALHARAVCHLRLQMPALAVEDASAAIRLRPDVAAHWRVRGAAWQVRGEPGPMCDDFYRACALGDCEGLRLARGRGQCRPPTDETDQTDGADGAGAFIGHVPPGEKPAMLQPSPQDGASGAMGAPDTTDTTSNPGQGDTSTGNGVPQDTGRDAGRKASLYELPDDSPAPRTLP